MQSAKDDFARICASQVADAIIECEQWRGVIDSTKQAAVLSVQRGYLAAVNLVFGDAVMLTDENDMTRFEHVRWRVAGAYSFARTYTIFVQCNLDMPRLQSISRWIPSRRLQRKIQWKEVN